MAKSYYVVYGGYARDSFDWGHTDTPRPVVFAGGFKQCIAYMYAQLPGLINSECRKGAPNHKLAYRIVNDCFWLVPGVPNSEYVTIGDIHD